MSKLDEILDKFVYHIDHDEFHYNCDENDGHIDFDKDQAKQAIYQAGMDMIGEDALIDPKEVSLEVLQMLIHENRQKQEMRIKWKEYCGYED